MCILNIALVNFHFATGDYYVAGALVLAFSIRKNLTQPVDFIVLVTKDVSKAARLTLSKIYGK